MMERKLVAPSAGQRIDPVSFVPTEVQLLRFSAATWNPHRIHYDQAYAAEEGYAGVLVQSHLHASFLAETVMRWAPPAAVIRRFSWSNRAVAVPGDTLTCSGRVEHVEPATDRCLATCALTEHNQDGVLGADGAVVLAWPVKSPRRTCCEHS